jgi:hypothetical protein
MTFKIVTADERMARTGIKGQIWGRAGIGKTSLLLTLPPESTLVLDFEAGLLAIGKHPVDSVPVKTWEEARDLACWIGGPNRSMRSEQPYSEAHFAHVCSVYGDPGVLDRYQTIFIDSTTIASQKCLQWAQGQPEAMSERSGKPDLRGAYGLLGREIVAWTTHLHHMPDKNLWLVGGLEEKTDDFNRKSWQPMIDGTKGASAMPYIVDEVITMAEFPSAATPGETFRAFVCQTLNPYGYPAKDRSGRLSLLEEPHLGRLMAKINGPEPDRNMTYDLDQQDQNS